MQIDETVLFYSIYSTKCRDPVVAIVKHQLPVSIVRVDTPFLRECLEKSKYKINKFPTILVNLVGGTQKLIIGKHKVMTYVNLLISQKQQFYASQNPPPPPSLYVTQPAQAAVAAVAGMSAPPPTSPMNGGNVETSPSLGDIVGGGTVAGGNITSTGLYAPTDSGDGQLSTPPPDDDPFGGPDTSAPGGVVYSPFDDGAGVGGGINAGRNNGGSGGGGIHMPDGMRQQSMPQPRSAKEQEKSKSIRDLAAKMKQDMERSLGIGDGDDFIRV